MCVRPAFVLHWQVAACQFCLPANDDDDLVSSHTYYLKGHSAGHGF